MKFRQLLLPIFGIGLNTSAAASNVDSPYFELRPQVPASILVIAQATRAKPIFVEQECREVGNTEDYVDSAYNNFAVGGLVLLSLGYKHNEKIGKFELPEHVRESFKMYVATPPAHGEAFQSAQNKEYMSYSYRAREGYTGKDSFVIGVDTLTRSGRKIHFSLKFKVSVVDRITNEMERSTCVGMKFSAAPSTAIAVRNVFARKNSWPWYVNAYPNSKCNGPPSAAVD